MAAITANSGVPGNALTTIQEYLDDRKWLFFERGMMTTWNELYLLSTLANDPQQSIIGQVEGRYNYKTGSTQVQPPTLSRQGVPAVSPPPNGY